MLANETQIGSITTKTSVKNSNKLTLGALIDEGNGLVGLMSYNGAYAENKSTGLMEINSKILLG